MSAEGAMKSLSVLLLSGLLLGGCAPAVFSQNIGPSHKIKTGMSPDDVRAVMRTPPAQTVSVDGVDEWRYCATRDDSDVIVIIYIQNQRVIDKATYTVEPIRQGDEESCLDSFRRVYTDRRSPPRRVQELRKRPWDRRR
jgi:hypothetical protein